MKLILCGAGKRCIELCRSIKGSKHEIVGVIDGNSMKWGAMIEGYMIQSPEEVFCTTDTRICITVGKNCVKQEIRDMLVKEYNYNLQSEIEYEELGYILCTESPIIQKELSKKINTQKKYNILFDCYSTGLGLGGIEEWTKQICEKLLENRTKNVYIVSKRGNYETKEILRNKIIYVDYGTKEPYSRLAVEQLIRVIIKNLPCKIITSLPNNMLLAACLVKEIFPEYLEIISVIHGGEEKFYSAYMREEMKADIYVGVSQDIHDCMIQKGLEKGKVHIMSCPFFCEEKLNRTYTIDNKEPIRIGYAGRLEIEQKRMDLLLRMFHLLAKKEVNFQAEIAGDGSMLDEMKTYVNQNQLSDKIVFLGNLHRSKISDFWKNKDICINIADYEGRSISIVEAMGNGAIPVVTMVSGTREDIVDGKNGYLIPIGDYVIMAERIKYLADNRNILAQMGDLAHAAVYPKSLMEPHIGFWKRILCLK